MTAESAAARMARRVTGGPERTPEELDSTARLLGTGALVALAAIGWVVTDVTSADPGALRVELRHTTTDIDGVARRMIYMVEVKNQ